MQNKQMLTYYQKVIASLHNNKDSLANLGLTIGVIVLAYALGCLLWGFLTTHFWSLVLITLVVAFAIDLWKFELKSRVYLHRKH